MQVRILDCMLLPLSDMGTNNVKAMKLLGSTGEKPFFQFQSQEIATIYDPPQSAPVTFLRNMMCRSSPNVISVLLILGWFGFSFLFYGNLLLESEVYGAGMF